MRDIKFSSVGTFIEPPTIEVSNDMGTSIYKSLPSLSKIGFSAILIATYKSPERPPFFHSPSPLTQKLYTPEEGATASDPEGDASSDNAGDNTVDAEFEEVKEEDK